MKRLLGKIITNDSIIERGEVCFDNGKTTYVGPIRENFEDCETIDFGDKGVRIIDEIWLKKNGLV